MQGLLSQVGYAVTQDPFEADLILLVTCSIREKAVHKVYSDLGRLRPLVEANPNLIVGVSGCVAQQEKSALFRRFPFLDLVFGPDAINQLPKMIAMAQSHKQNKTSSRILNTRFHSRKDFEFVNLIRQDEENRVKAFVTIQKGCDNVCAFCIVPAVRGAEVSRRSDDVIEEINRLVDLSVSEVTLLGQNVNSYGLKHSGELSFAQLLEKIATETKIKRLRFTSSHPKDVGDDLVACYRDLDILCPHFHLPVQSGSDRILKAMRRQYTRRDYLKKIKKLRDARPDIHFTSDIIVGFPGETQQDFEQTLSLMEEVLFDACYSFIYSSRPCTTASKLTRNVDRLEKARRLKILQNFQNRISQSQHKKLIGSHQKVLVDKEDDLGHNLIGRTATNILVSIPKPGRNQLNLNSDWIGSILEVKITEAQPNSLLGEVVDDIRINDQSQSYRAYN